MPRLCIAIVTLVALGPAQSSSPALDESFARWLQVSKDVRYGELATRFLQAAGRDDKGYARAMGELGRRFEEFLREDGSPGDARERCDALRRFLFEEQGFRADLDLNEVDNLFPDAILRRKRGYCLGLSLVILHLAELVNWPLQAASAPRHTFVRHLGEKGHINLETTLGGQILDDRWYEDRFDLSGSGAGSKAKTLRTLSPRQTGAHLLNNHGFVLLNADRLEDASAEISLALEIFPELVEARINEGVVRARRGEFQKALRSFDHVLEDWPRDPYVRKNRANALVSLGRRKPAAEALADLLESHPTLPGVADATRHLRADLDLVKEWSLVQTLTIRLNAARAATGRSPGLRATYFRDSNLQSPCSRRVDKDISFSWGRSSPGDEIPRDNFSVRWNGWLDIPRADKYSFFVICSDGVRLWIDGRQVINAWRRANDNSGQGELQLDAGLHDIRVEYFESVGEAGIKILVTAESQEEVLTLEKLLAHPDRP